MNRRRRIIERQITRHLRRQSFEFLDEFTWMPRRLALLDTMHEHVTVPLSDTTPPEAIYGDDWILGRPGTARGFFARLWAQDHKETP